MPEASVQRKFSDALDRLIEQVKVDHSVLAALLCGSLSHDTVWEKSDIDLILITVDDRKIPSDDRALYADGVNVHTILMPRAEFRKAVEGSIRNSFLHSLLAKGRLLYTHDETIADLCQHLGEIGARDTQMQLLGAASYTVGAINKARTWLVTRGDLEYSALFVLGAANGVAKMEVISAGLIADREVIPQATRLNPPLFRTIYLDLLNCPKTTDSVEGAIAAIEDYLGARAKTVFAPVLAHLEEVGEARSATELEDHFKRNYGIEGVTAACEYLADAALIGKASVSIQLTKRSNVTVQELAFFPLAGPLPEDGF
jgi:uncharacterized protein